MTGEPIRIVIAGGGTGGHVQPAVATLEVLRRHAAIEALWIGSHTGVERSVSEREGIPFQAIETGKLRRYLSLQTPIDAARIPFGLIQAYRLLRRFRPQVVFSTGGFVSVPTVLAARRLGIRSLTHEQTAIVGLANRINARFADVVALSYEQSRALLGRTRGTVIVTGNPIRPSLFDGQPRHAFDRFNLDPALPLTYVTGGALGAQAINITVAASLPDLLVATQVIHQCGRHPGEEERLIEARSALDPELQLRYVVVPLVGPELADVYAAAALVIGRAGAGTVAELAALGKPSILVPLPGSAGAEQIRNARLLADAGASILLPQEELGPAKLVDTVTGLLTGEDLDAMAQAARTRGQPEAAEKLATAILDLAACR